ncbi:hypothetical protein [uncultured Psychroserpens sp.]|uniref:hypothetical protein n=1 Tax=uncultured Psychroserpens sp. TaxID=255436 RepID=UPI002603A78C|nr:hypothetical protein [uncultured Psychroserpens sp.]
MKWVVLVSFVFCLCSCSNAKEENKSLTPILIDYVDNMPYLMHEKDIDSTFEIIVSGSINRFQLGDTSSYSIKNKFNIVNENIKGFMCCHNTYKYDSLGLLVKRNLFTDYSELFVYERQRKGDTIFESRVSNVSWSIYYTYVIQNERLISRVGQLGKGAFPEDLDFYDVTHFEYNEDNLLVKKIRTRKNHPSGEFQFKKNVLRYNWNNGVLRLVEDKMYAEEDAKDPLYTITTDFDSIGFPSHKTIQYKKDTLCQLSIQRSKQKSVFSPY